MKRRMAILAVLMFGALPCATVAGELDLTGNLSGFSSPGDLYGPWRTLSTTYRWGAGKDTPSVTLVTRADGDRLGPTHSNGGTVDDYHDWGPRFFTYAALGTAGGGVLPTRNIYVEGDRKFGAALNTVAGAGFGVVVNPNGVVQRYVNVGPSYYGSGFNVTLRYLQTFTTGRTGAGTAIATIQTGQTGKTISTVTLLTGNQPPNGIAEPAQPALFGQRATFAGVGIKHWTGPGGGWTAGIELERLNDRAGGTALYARRGLNLGIFRNIGPPLP
jgi:YaiO family outer membrane protein